MFSHAESLRKISSSRILSSVTVAREGMMVTPSVRLVRPLGEGGMGAVWIADHLALSTQVVVKFISGDLEASPEAKERFTREAAAAAQVKSPHVVQTFDHGTTESGTPYIVMELLEGRDLGAYLDEVGKADGALVVEIVAQLARALDRAHDRGIVHRDIKPGNIFLCDAGRGEVFVKLLDFGIAKGVDIPRLDSNTKTGAMIGSPFYMSPEQILGSKDVDKRSDLWAVGVVAFEALTGRKPFDAETMGGLAIKIHSEPLPIPTQIDASLSPAVDAWFAKACARNVTERFESAQELAGELAKALGGAMPRSLPVPRPSGGGMRPEPALVAGATTEAGVVTNMPRPKRRNLVLGLGVAAALGVGAFGVTTAFKKPPAPVAIVASDSAPPSDHSSVAVSPPASPEPPPPTPSVSETAAAPPKPAQRPRGRPAPPLSRTSANPSPPSTTVAAPPAVPPPATSSGHDIF